MYDLVIFFVTVLKRYNFKIAHTHSTLKCLEAFLGIGYLLVSCGEKKMIVQNESREIIVGRAIEFDMAHRLPLHKGKCKSLHGHRYQVEVSLKGIIQSGSTNERAGMVVDYGEIKSVLCSVIFEPFDHSVTLYEKDPLVPLIQSVSDQKLNIVPFMPTAEELAFYFYSELSREFSSRNALICDRVTVRESSETFAIYERKT